MDPSAKVEDWAAVGRGVVVEAGAAVRRSVLWDGARVGRGVRVEDSVLAEGVAVDRDVKGEVKLG
jgi:NDP-sugar pyrophosphorylase family protein